MAKRTQAGQRTTKPGPTTLSAGQVSKLRSMMGELSGRLQLGELAGHTFDAKRDMFAALGYKKTLQSKDYLARYERSEVAERVAEALPNATWRGSGELVEDEDPNTVTQFEEAWLALADRLSVWDTFRKADILSGLGYYGIILIGAPGRYEEELPRMTKQEDILYLTPYHEDKVKMQDGDLVKETEDPRYGLPKFYEVQTSTSGRGGTTRKVHWTRVVHISEGALHNPLFGKPRLRSIWNRLDDLEKIVGGGAEAYWQQVQPGYKLVVDRDVEMTPEMEQDLSKEIDEFMHGMRRYARMRATDMSPIGASEVSPIERQMDAILTLISVGTGIPKRILMGSERGELSSTQDRSNWDQRVDDRREQFASTALVKPFVSRMIASGALPTPVSFSVRWPSIKDMDDQEVADIAVKWATVNARAGETVVTADEIRDRVLNLPPLDELIDGELVQARGRRRFLTKRGRVSKHARDPETARLVSEAVAASVHGTDSVPMRTAMSNLAAHIAAKRTA